MTEFHEKMSNDELKQAAVDYALSQKNDLALWGIIAGNIFTIVIAIIQGWSLGDVMWVYWGQSIVIGIMNFFRMWNLKNFSTEGLTSNGRPVPETEKGARNTAIFFAVHYGFFHLGYLIFMFADHGTDIVAFDVVLMGLSLLVFFASHLFSLSRNIRPDMEGPRPNLGTIMFMPYLRIIPMHLTIILGAMFFGNSVVGIIFFMSLKTLADAGTHLIEHYIYQQWLKKGGSA
jgi:hypothetical protein